MRKTVGLIELKFNAFTGTPVDPFNCNFTAQSSWMAYQ